MAVVSCSALAVALYTGRYTVIEMDITVGDKQSTTRYWFAKACWLHKQQTHWFMTDQPKILSLQPFFSGSHRAVMQGWVKHSTLDWKVISLPGELWKWRMRYAAIHFAKQANSLDESGHRFDAVFCTDMMNLAEFKGLVNPRISELPTVIYFHENQLAYPIRNPGRQDLHFAFTNLVSALAADQVWFNSCFNRDSMCEMLREHSGKWPEQVLQEEIEQIQERGVAHYPGIEIPDGILNRAETKKNNQTDKPLHIVWAARWEHDKGPDDLLLAIRFLMKQQADFRLSVIGETYREIPQAFETLQQLCKGKILKWGFQETRADYWQVLSDTDVFVSTAKHEFFGLSAAEAIIAGCFPLLPDRLAYPELLDIASHPDHKVFLYDGSTVDLGRRLLSLIQNRSELDEVFETSISETFQANCSWSVRAKQQDETMKRLIATGS